MTQLVHSFSNTVFLGLTCVNVYLSLDGSVQTYNLNLPPYVQVVAVTHNFLNSINFCNFHGYTCPQITHTQLTCRTRTDMPICREGQTTRLCFARTKHLSLCRRGCHPQNWLDGGGCFTPPCSNQFYHWTVGVLSLKGDWSISCFS